MPASIPTFSHHSRNPSAFSVLRWVVFAGQSGLGYLSRVRSIADGYIIGGLATVLALPVLALLRRLGERADVIEGGDCGCPAAPCAGQGLPDIDLVDATPRRSV